MLSVSLRKALLACAASAVLAYNLVHSCSAATAGETAPPTPSQNGAQGRSSVATAAERQEYVPGPSGFLEGKNPASQVAALSSGRRLESPAFLGSSGDQVEAPHSLRGSGDEPSPKFQSSGATVAVPPLDSAQNRTRAAGRRRLEGPFTKSIDAHALLSRSTSPRGISSRRLQLLAGISQLTQLPQLSTLPNLLGSGLSARDKDQLETFSRRVGTSRERVYKDLLFATGGRQHGMDEFAMKQLVAKIGLENLSSGNAPSSAQLSPQEFRVLDAARRNHFTVERIIAAYERDVAQHAKTLRKELEANLNNPSIRAKITSIASDNLFRRPRDVSIRRLQESQHNRSLATLLQGSGLFGTASSLIRSMDPSSLTQSLSAGLGGLGLQHLYLPNIGSLGLRQDGTSQPLLPITDLGGLQQALQSVFPLSQQVTALSGPLRSFQQGVETATDGTIGAFLSREGLLPFLSVDTAKELLGGLIGGEAVGFNALRGWDDLGLSPVAVNGLASVMPFDTFLNKFASLAHEVDSDVGVMKTETKKRLGAGGFSILPEQLKHVDSILDRLVWGTLRAPVRRLQQTEGTEEMRLDGQPHLQVGAQHMTAAPWISPPKPTAALQHLSKPTQQTLEPLMVPAHPPQQKPPSIPALRTNMPSPPQISVPTPEQANPGLERPAPETGLPIVEPEMPTAKPELPTSELMLPIPQPDLPTSQPDTPVSEPEMTVPQPEMTIPEMPTPDPELPTPEPELPPPEPEEPVPKPEQPAFEPQHPASEPEEKAPVEQGSEENQQLQDQQKEDNSAVIDNILGALLDEELEGVDSEEEMHAALQRVELLADAVTVLLKEYEKAVEHLQDLLDDQLDAAEEIREELEDQIEEFQDQVKSARKQKKQAASAAAAEVARAYDDAMEGFKASLEALLEQPQTTQPASPAMQEELAALAARIQAAAEERLPSLVTAH
ncbi:hypothetical protein, conserved [Eimeria brunetti]|uniref:Transmembrane protein n=1 Tax=Eimeria brunetti TaxID=51314 RepID=U6LKQ9_9EIME|nr:hypothetical protein, conserved [Eimeria brunetti]